MSEASQGPGWWIASDGRWYPPEFRDERPAPLPADTDGPPGHVAARALTRWAPEAVFQPSAVSADAAPAGAVPADADRAMAPTSSGGRFRRGVRLVGIGFTMARDEPGLMGVPVVAFVVQLIVIGAGALLVIPGLRSGGNSVNGGTTQLAAGQWLVIVVAGVLVMFVSVVSHATIIARVMARFHGQRISNAQAARATLTKSPQLLAWAFINYVVISMLRTIGNRGILGAVVGWLFRAGWMLASFFVVPVILFEDRGALSAIKRSVGLCRQRWGENVIGNSALAIIGTVAIFVDLAVAVLLGMAFAPLGAVVGVLGLVALALVVTVASAAFNAALYWYAVTGQAPGQYSVGDLQSAYRQKGRRTGIYGV